MALNDRIKSEPKASSGQAHKLTYQGVTKWTYFHINMHTIKLFVFIFLQHKIVLQL